MILVRPARLFLVYVLVLGANFGVFAGEFTIQSYSGIQRFLDQDIPVESTGVSNKLYIAPNEFEAHLLKPILTGRQGVLLSVGTFRTMQNASYGEFSDVIFFDINPGASAFNRINLRIADVATNQREWMYLLFKGHLPANKTAYITPREWVEIGTASRINNKLRKAWHEQLGIDSAILQEVPDMALFKLLHRVAEFGEATETPLQRTSPVFSNFKAKSERMSSHVITGSLAGPGTLKKMAATLEENDKYISVIDVSNVPDYIVQSDFKNYVENLSALPLTDDAVVIQTRNMVWHLDRARAGGNSVWEYFVFPAKTYIEEISKLDSVFELELLLERLYSEKPIDPGAAQGLTLVSERMAKRAHLNGFQKLLDCLNIFKK